LVGELTYVHVRGVWRLRYALPESPDAYGGMVTLTGTELPAGVRNGQLVRVEGKLCDPASREPSPAYQVRAVTVLPAP
jgi:hypothetical protein